MTAGSQPASLLLPPQVGTTRLSTIGVGLRRLEAEQYLSEGCQIRRRLIGLGADVTELRTLAEVWQPSRLKGIQLDRERGLPFLAASQVFDVRPTPRKWLAAARTPDLEARYVEPGWIVTVRFWVLFRAFLHPVYQAIQPVFLMSFPDWFYH